MVYPFAEILLIIVKERNPAVCGNSEEPTGCDAKWNKPVTEGKYCISPPVICAQNIQPHRSREQNRGYQGPGKGETGAVQLVYSFSSAK